MDIYSKKSRWKLYLLLAASGIVIASMLYTTNVANRLAEQERGRVELWAKAMSELLNTSGDEACKDQELDFIFSIVVQNKTIPAILTDSKGKSSYKFSTSNGLKPVKPLDIEIQNEIDVFAKST